MADNVVTASAIYSAIKETSNNVVTASAIYSAIRETSTNIVTAGAIYNAVIETNITTVTAGAIYLAAFSIVPPDPSNGIVITSSGIYIYYESEFADCEDC